MRVYFCLTVEKAGFDATHASQATVYNPVPANDKALRIALACVGIKSPVIVRQPANAHLSYRTEPPSFRDGRSSTPLIANFDEHVLAALEPRATIEVASLAQRMPSTRWSKDDGGLMIVFPGDRIRFPQEVQPVSKPWRVNVAKALVPAAYAHLPVPPIDVPGIFSVGYTRMSKRLAAIDRIPLKNGDSILDLKGVTWYFVGGRLQDRLHATINANDVVMQGRTISPKDQRLVIVRDAAYELTILDASGTIVRTVPCKAMEVADGRSGWQIDDTVASTDDAKSFVCMDSDGVAKLGIDRLGCENIGGVWDKPCGANDECPYYDPRRARGGCLQSGYCEFPLGVDVTSYRTAKGRAMLRGCSESDPSYPWCTGQSPRNARFPVDRKA